MSLLDLELSGPLASWSTEPTYTVRRTDDRPGRGAILGLIGNVMGLDRDECGRKLSDIAIRSVEIVRTPVEGEDYHTIRRRRDGGSIVIRDRVLMDGAWRVTIEAGRDRLERIADAFRHPARSPYLGRRAYIPDRPIVPANAVIHEDPFDLAREAA